MIHRIYSSLKSFKNLEFHSGLNILLSDKNRKATERQTRNRAGKTSLIEIIHFLTGANIGKKSIFKAKDLFGCAFSMEFDIQNSSVTVERSIPKSSNVVLMQVNKEISQLSRIPAPDILGYHTISNLDWKSILGQLIFHLPENQTKENKKAGKFGPTFRSLYSYFVRRQLEGGFISPFQHSKVQKTYDWQVSISYLIGVDWTIPQQLEFVREKERSLKELKKVAEEGILDKTIGTTAQLRTELTVAENRLIQLKERVNNFLLLPEYEHFEKEASELTLRINDLADENTIHRELIAELERSMEDEITPSEKDLGNLYKEVGVVLPDTVLRRFDEVKKFHKSVIQNRKLYLIGEIEAAKNKILKNEKEKQRLESRRSQVMAILKSHGALDQLTELQTELARLTSETETLRHRFAAAEQIEELKSELKIEREQIRRRLRQDYQEQINVLDQAILAFEETSKVLYEDAGSLTIDASLNGPEFDVKIHGSRSKGITNMQIFCFDMMLMRLCAERGIGPGFLVHDSHLFDGVDERQVGKALQVGAEIAEKLGFQYIVTLNSDQLPEHLPDGFDLEKYILTVRLTDETETGGLFGLRFN